MAVQTLAIPATSTTPELPAPEIVTPQELDFDARYTVAGMPGVAFYVAGYATEWTEGGWFTACGNPEHVCDYDEDRYDEDEDGEDTHGPDCYLYDEPEEIERRDMVKAVMVGDDREHMVDVDDLTEISEDDYCPGCGQTGCMAYA